MPHDQRDLYNIVTIKNVDDQDFIFSVDNQPYMIRAGATHNFPRFMARIAIKHLIDKILEKRDKDGKLMANAVEREKLADEIVVNEQHYEQPAIPTDQDVVEEINQPSDMDVVLRRNRDRMKRSIPRVAQPEPVEDLNEEPVQPKEEFSGLKNEEKKSPEPTEVKLPTRDEIMSHAKNVLKLDITDPKSVKAWEKLSDQELFDEFQMDKI